MAHSCHGQAASGRPGGEEAPGTRRRPLHGRQLNGRRGPDDAEVHPRGPFRVLLCAGGFGGMVGAKGAPQPLCTRARSREPVGRGIPPGERDGATYSEPSGIRELGPGARSWRGLGNRAWDYHGAWSGIGGELTSEDFARTGGRGGCLPATPSWLGCRRGCRCRMSPGGAASARPGAVARGAGVCAVQSPSATANAPYAAAFESTSTGALGLALGPSGALCVRVRACACAPCTSGKYGTRPSPHTTAFRAPYAPAGP